MPSRRDRLLAHAAARARELGLGEDGAQVAQAILVTEGGMDGAVGDRGQSFGPFQFHRRGQLPNFARALGVSVAQAAQIARDDPETAIDWALGGYLGDAIKRGQAAKLTGPALATYAQKTGQVSVTPQRAGQNYRALQTGNGFTQTTADMSSGGTQMDTTSEDLDSPSAARPQFPMRMTNGRGQAISKAPYLKKLEDDFAKAENELELEKQKYEQQAANYTKLTSTLGSRPDDKDAIFQADAAEKLLDLTQKRVSSISAKVEKIRAEIGDQYEKLSGTGPTRNALGAKNATGKQGGATVSISVGPDEELDTSQFDPDVGDAALMMNAQTNARNAQTAAFNANLAAMKNKYEAQNLGQTQARWIIEKMLSRGPIATTPDGQRWKAGWEPGGAMLKLAESVGLKGLHPVPAADFDIAGAMGQGGLNQFDYNPHSPFSRGGLNAQQTADMQAENAKKPRPTSMDFLPYHDPAEHPEGRGDMPMTGIGPSPAAQAAAAPAPAAPTATMRRPGAEDGADNGGARTDGGNAGPAKATQPLQPQRWNIGRPPQESSDKGLMISTLPDPYAQKWNLGRSPNEASDTPASRAPPWNLGRQPNEASDTPGTRVPPVQLSPPEISRTRSMQEQQITPQYGQPSPLNPPASPSGAGPQVTLSPPTISSSRSMHEQPPLSPITTSMQRPFTVTSSTDHHLLVENLINEFNMDPDEADRVARQMASGY